MLADVCLSALLCLHSQFEQLMTAECRIHTCIYIYSYLWVYVYLSDADIVEKKHKDSFWNEDLKN